MDAARSAGVLLLILLCALAPLSGCAQAKQANERFWKFNDDTYTWMMKDNRTETELQQ